MEHCASTEGEKETEDQECPAWCAMVHGLDGKCLVNIDTGRSARGQARQARQAAQAKG